MEKIMGSSFGNFLKEKRLETNLTQKDLAKLLLVSESAVSKWEKDVARPDISLLTKISEILGVSEHELITASIDKRMREEKVQAKKWRAFSMSWSLFFYISYVVALIPCFICDLAINKSLTWFWIVVSALLLAFTFTNLPKLIKKHKLLILPISMYLSLVLLLGVCCIYTKGDWFIIPVLAVLFAVLIIFVPIYISKYKLFEKIRKYNDFISLAIDYVFLNILLIVIDIYTVLNGYSTNHWYISLGFPIVGIAYLVLNIMMSIRFLKVNKLMKTSFILYFINIMYLFVPLLKVKDQYIQREIVDCNIFKANLSIWQVGVTLEQNINLIIFLTILGVATLCLAFGIYLNFKKKKN